jgi:hypothetical protein
MKSALLLHTFIDLVLAEPIFFKEHWERSQTYLYYSTPPAFVNNKLTICLYFFNYRWVLMLSKTFYGM